MTETVNTFEEAEPNQDYEAEMLAKGEALEQANNPDRPEWLPEKFTSAEDMAQAYAALERKLGSSEEGEQQEQQETEYEEDSEYEEEETELTNEAEASDVEQALDSVGLDFNSFQQEYTETGELSDDAYMALEEKGFSRELVDTWISGQQALVDQQTSQIFSMVGGVDSYAEMTQWAANNLSQSEIDAYNANVESGDMALAQFAVSGLAARYRSEVGNEPRLVQGNAAPSSSGAFQSVAELTAAMRDPRYGNDPAYRNSVAEKLKRSNVF
jgi:hypothetical protein